MIKVEGNEKRVVYKYTQSEIHEGVGTDHRALLLEEGFIQNRHHSVGLVDEKQEDGSMVPMVYRTYEKTRKIQIKKVGRPDLTKYDKSNIGEVHEVFMRKWAVGSGYTYVAVIGHEEDSTRKIFRNEDIKEIE